MGVSIQQPYIAKYYLNVKCFEASTYVKKAGLKVGMAQEHLHISQDVYAAAIATRKKIIFTRKSFHIY